MEPLLLRVPEAAKLIGLGKSKFYQLVRAGQIPVVKVGRATRVPAAGLRDWVAGQEGGPHLTVKTVIDLGGNGPEFERGSR